MVRGFFFVTLFLLTAGCYTFRVPATIDDSTIATVGKSKHTIELVMDQVYREFKSTDRGHPLADPQTYDIGPALTELTERYFKQGFPSVIVSEREESMSVPAVNFLVQPFVARFSNKVTMFPMQQTLGMELGAVVSTPEGRKIGSVSGSAVDTHSVAAIRASETRISAILGTVIQAALAQLVNNVIGIIE